MKKLFVTLLMVLMVTSVFAESQEQYIDLTNNWVAIKQSMSAASKESNDLIIRTMYCTEKEKALIVELLVSYGSVIECVEWAEEHFEQRGSSNLTLTVKEFKTYQKMLDPCIKRYFKAVAAYEAYLN